MEYRIININHQIQCIGMKLHIQSTKTNAVTRKVPMTEDVYRCFAAILEDRVANQNEKMIDGHI